MMSNRNLLILAVAASLFGGVMGAGGAYLLYGQRIDRLDHDVEVLDDRSAAVARLDPKNVKECLDFSTYALDAQQHGDMLAVESYHAHMGRINCSKVMAAIRQVR